jgi:hypothetical protein
MRNLGVFVVLGVLLALGVSASVASADARTVFKATLTGSQVEPPTDVQAEGRATFKVGKAGGSQDETSLDCLLTVRGVEDAMSAYIHDGNGNVLVYLHPARGVEPSVMEGRFSGLAVQRTIEDGDSTRLADGVTLAHVIDLMGKGDASITVTTGAFPGGAIRGQID